MDIGYLNQNMKVDTTSRLCQRTCTKWLNWECAEALDEESGPIAFSTSQVHKLQHQHGDLQRASGLMVLMTDWC